MAIFPLALPVSGSSKAADTTTTTTTSASTEASTNNANINGDNAVDSSFDDLFSGDVDYSNGDLFGEDSSASASANASVIPEAPRNDVLSRWEDIADNTAIEGYAPWRSHDVLSDADFGEHEDLFAGPSASQPTIPARQAEPPNGNDYVPAMFANGIIPVPANAESAPAAPLQGLQLALPPGGRRELQDPERVVPANDAPITNAPIDGEPAKRGRGRPKGSKAPPKEKVYYRCRYGCQVGKKVESRDLRKHMMRIHCLFLSQKELRVCQRCTKTYSPEIKDLPCNGGHCKRLTDAQRAAISVTRPRDAQEEADTFAYLNSGPNNLGPSRLVIRKDGDDEDQFREWNKQAINSWRAGANHAQFIHGLLTPNETPSPPNGQTTVDLTGDDEDAPVTPLPAYKGKGKGRAMDYPIANHSGNDEHVPATASPAYVGKGKGRARNYPVVDLPASNAEVRSLPQKRAADSPSEEEPAAKRTMLNVSYNETEAFAGPARRRSTAVVTDLLADFMADFPESENVDLAGVGSSSGAAFSSDASGIPAAMQSNYVDPTGVEYSVNSAFGLDVDESDVNGCGFDLDVDL
jgi:hypothetical protein